MSGLSSFEIVSYYTGVSEFGDDRLNAEFVEI